MKKEEESVAVAWPRLRKIKEARRGRLERCERERERKRETLRRNVTKEGEREGKEWMNGEKTGRGWWREKRGSRPTSSENSSPVEFLISPRHPHPRKFQGWKKKSRREREEKKESAKAEVEKEQVEGVGWIRRGGIVMRAFFTDFSTPVTAGTPVGNAPYPASPRTGSLHPLAPTERAAAAAAVAAAAAPFS